MNKEIGNRLIDYINIVSRFAKAIGDHSPTLEPAAHELRISAQDLREAIMNSPVTP